MVAMALLNPEILGRHASMVPVTEDDRVIVNVEAARRIRNYIWTCMANWNFAEGSPTTSQIFHWAKCEAKRYTEKKQRGGSNRAETLHWSVAEVFYRIENGDWPAGGLGERR
jgi:hypothetical protein